MLSPKYQAAAILIVALTIFRPSLSQSHFVDYLEDDAQRGSQENVIAKSLRDLLDAEMDFPFHNPQRFTNTLPSSGSSLINPWQAHLPVPTNYIFTPLRPTSFQGSQPIPRSLPKRKESPDLKRYNKYFKKADSTDRKSRNSNYRQCFFNPISCFRK